MVRVGKFEKVSFEQFLKDMKDTFGEKYFDAQIKFIYDDILLPKRATKDSAGYDFHSPIIFTLKPNETIKIPTGIKVKIDEGWVLKCYPRSSLGFKYRFQLDNIVGIIDGDYYYSDNEGHIFAKLTNCSNENKTICVDQNDRFMQGIFVQYGITYNDEVDGIRNGGFGSTNQK
jgi:dUTP pyrophosphatase